MKMNNFKMDLVLSTVQSDQTPIYLNSSRVPYVYKKESKLVDIDGELNKVRNLILELLSRKDLDFHTSGEFRTIINSIAKIYNNFNVKVYKSIRDIITEYNIGVSENFSFNGEILATQDFELKPTIDTEAAFTTAYNRVALNEKRADILFRMLTTFRIYVNVGNADNVDYKPTPLVVHFMPKD